ncbi:MAG: nucleoid-associated protein [Opitutaceae bacterium]|nr:nucleoid-associated protein [Cytophagales bacterium]
MLNFSNSQLDKLAAHFVGNKTLDEDLKLTSEIVNGLDEAVLSLLQQYFLGPFKSTGEYYHLKHETGLELNEIYAFVSKIFKDNTSFLEQSQNIAKHLYEKSTHPKVKAGDMYVGYFSNCVVEDEETDCIGIFKSENKDKYLKVYNNQHGYEMAADEGININKLDKGCLIFNTEKDKGYIVVLVDNLNKQEGALYWKDEFLKVKPREDNYYHTQGYMKMYDNFVQDKLKVDYDVSKADEIDIQNRTKKFFKEKETFDFQEFANDVIQQPEIIDKFRDFKHEYQETHEVTIADEFNISDKAVKKQSKFYKSIIKLDKNFHIYVHGNKENIEKGVDETTGMNYYKLLFREES